MAGDYFSLNLSLSTFFSRFLKNKMPPLKPHQLQRNSHYEKDQPELFSHLIKRNLSCSNLSSSERKHKFGWIALSSLQWLTAARESLVPHRHKSRHSPSPGAFMDWIQKWQPGMLTVTALRKTVTGSCRSQGTFPCTLCSCYCSRALCWSSPYRERTASSSPTCF